ncbi:MAG: hypothetical protein QXU33_05885 [Candidatus Methanomethyliaceae archaeon]
MKPRQKYLHLLEDPDVRRWYENVARGSITTAEVYLRRLGFFCSSLGSTPRELAAACLKTALRVLFAVMLIIGPAVAACTAFRYHYDRIMEASTEERQAIYDAGSVVANPWHLVDMMGLDRND